MTDPEEPRKPVPSVRNVGAVAAMGDDAKGDPEFARVALRLFATTDAGDRVLDPREVSTSLRIDRSKLAGLELSVQMSLRLRAAPSGVRLEAWQRIAAELAARGIETDPETLHGLGFALVPDEEIKAAQALSGR
ncbi:MAG TPA: hypothetical protein VGF63_12950 [Solirubrobacteraceae bacterium]|jgi:hypothetical protein